MLRFTNPGFVLLIISFVNKMAITAFNKSKTITSNPNFLPKTLPVLLPPRFPLPYCLMSFLKNTLLIIKAFGIEPRI